MPYPKLNIFSALIIGAITMTSCNAPQGVLNRFEDDVYFSRKAAGGKPVYVPEVDVNEIIKNNPPQYGNGNQLEEDVQPNQYNDGRDYTNPNAAEGYKRYKEAQQRENEEAAVNNDGFLSTVPYAGYEEEASEASLLRRQYAGNYGGYFARPGRFNRWGRPGLNIGWNTFTGWGVGFGWNNGWNKGWNSGWNTGWNTGYGFGWPHYNNFYDPFWGNSYWCSPYNNFYNPWGFNTWGYNPWVYNPWGGYYGYNNWFGWHRPHHYVGGWGQHQFENNTPNRVYRPRGDGAGSNMPRSADGGRVAMPRGGQTQTPQPNQGRTVLPKSGNEAQLINRDGQPVYVAPNQYRNTTPRSYESYPKSVDQERNYREVAPPKPREVAPTRPSGNNRDYTAPTPNRNDAPTYRGNDAPTFRRNDAPAPAPRNYSPAPSRGGGQASPPSGGSRGGSGGGGGGSAPRSRPR